MKRNTLLAGVLFSALGLGTASAAPQAEFNEPPKDEGLPGTDVDVGEGQDIEGVDDPGAPGVDVDINDTNEDKKAKDQQDKDKGMPGMDADLPQE